MTNDIVIIVETYNKNLREIIINYDAPCEYERDARTEESFKGKGDEAE
tara:strand:- start:47 stop:190 length:144 start_codon:yes stop_codon:yes gene_type:complete